MKVNYCILARSSKSINVGNRIHFALDVINFALEIFKPVVRLILLSLHTRKDLEYL